MKFYRPSSMYFLSLAYAKLVNSFALRKDEYSLYISGLLICGFLNSCCAVTRPVDRRPEDAVAPFPRYPETADRIPTFDNRPLAPERSQLKKSEKKATAAKQAAAAYDSGYGFQRPESYEQRPKQQQAAAGPERVYQTAAQDRVFTAAPEQAYAAAPEPAEPKKQKKVFERQVCNDDIFFFHLKKKC